jgi:hypothetical protein
MKSFVRLLILLFTTIGWISVFAQKKDSTWVGTVDGVVFDSIHNYVLQSATLAVYNVKDSSLVSYQLSNNFGEFHFKDLPVGIRLTIVASFVGYKSYTRKFTIPAKSKNLDLKNLILERGENSLQEVVVKSVPPVTMNGDTLEFNADAFKLDKNAVVEDLMRKLPGITLWGDGTITVNGKQVKSVLVDGKPFFGSDTRVATQNLPKDAVDKIQVYQQNRNKENPLDSVTEVNIKLKKNKQFGHFGKLGAGYGNNKRFEADGNLNFFSSKTQLGVVGASNNINKVAGDVNRLMRNSTYKGVGANIEYQPDFSMSGTNQPNSGGFIFQHDFIPNADYYKNNRLTANYFINNNNTKILQDAQTITSLGGDSILLQANNSSSQSYSTTQNFITRYDKHKDNTTLYATTTLNATNGDNHVIQQNSSSGSRQGLQSTNNADNDNHNDSKNISLETGISHVKSFGKLNHLPGFDVSYSFNTGNNNSNQTNKTTFISISDPTQNKLFDRTYDNSSNDTKQHLSFKLENLSGGSFAIKRMLSGIILQLQNNLDVNTHSENNTVKDRDIITGNYLFNQYLTNNNRLTTVNEMPALNLSRAFYKSLSNRYDKSLSFNFSAQAQFYHQKNISDHFFQNYRHNYQKFIPNASVGYNNYQYGDFQDVYNLSFSVSADYPTVQQLFPLVDSSNLYDVQQGNAGLKPTDKKVITFSFTHTSFRAKNTFNYNISIMAGITNNSFADSSITDNLGRSTHYTVNADGNKSLSVMGSLNKAFKFTNDHQLQISLSPLVSLTHTPNNINGVWNSSDNFSNSNTLNFYYIYKDWLAINLKQGYSYYHSKQSGLYNVGFDNSTLSSAFSASLNCTRKLTVSSNITYNHSSSTGSNVTNFTIWNANVAYRLFKENNAEIKFAALDLLHQNTSIINYGSDNTLTHGTVNVLQQYFMVTLSYFPRRFGKKKEQE